MSNGGATTKHTCMGKQQFEGVNGGMECTEGLGWQRVVYGSD